MSYDGHDPERPSWNCRCCGEPWPCRQAQKEMIATYSPTQIAIMMWVELESVAADMRAMPIGDMFDRFLRWTWRPPA